MPVPLKLRADNNFTIDIMLCLEFPIQAFHQVNYFILFYFLCFLLGLLFAWGRAGMRVKDFARQNWRKQSHSHTHIEQQQQETTKYENDPPIK